MSRDGLRVAVLGATGSVGGELLSVLEERGFPIRGLRVFASEESAGLEVEFRGEDLPVETPTPDALRGFDAIFNCASAQLVDTVLETAERSSCLIDLSGALELDATVPLVCPGLSFPSEAQSAAMLAIPRGAAAGIGLSLGPIAREVGIARVTIVVLESASGEGRRGIHEFTEQTVNILNAMTGDEPVSSRFPRSLAFDCLPLVGLALEGGESSEERRLAHVLRRLLAQPALPVESTRVRVPIFGGSLACVHAELAGEIELEALHALWEKQPEIELVADDDLPTPRAAMARDRIFTGRVRHIDADPRRLAFVLAMDDLRYGSAVAAVVAAERRFGLA